MTRSSSRPARRILLVDGDVEFHERLAAALAPAGIEVVLALTAEFALLLLARERVAAVLVDARVGGSDGIALIEALRRRGDRTPAVYLSSEWIDGATFRRLTGELEVAQIVHKPVIPAVFAAQLSQLLSLGEVRAEAAG
ncbi:MAG: response regulator, partial [Myxococcales bacterium]